MFVTTSATAQITPREAQALPVADLAARVLGPTGIVMVAVDRPTWPGPLAGKGDPPVTALTFYQHPQTSYAGEGWQGLCQSLAVTVYYDAAHAVRSLETRNVYSAGDLRRVLPLPSVRDNEETERVCSRTRIGTDTFYAESRNDAATAAIALFELRHAKRNSKGWPFTYNCLGLAGDCSTTTSPANVASIYVDGGWEVRTDAPWCPNRPSDTRTRLRCLALIKQNGCFSVSTLYLRVEKRKDDVRLSRARYEDSRIVC